jgi:thymidylate synthase ThyX
MKEMKERTALGEAILKHWREHCPQMVQDLEKENRLDQTVFETQERTGDLLYELVSVKKMDYHAAWELAAQEWALPQGENKSEDQSGNLPPAETSPSGTSRSTTSRRSRPRGRLRGTSG